LTQVPGLTFLVLALRLAAAAFFSLALRLVAFFDFLAGFAHAFSAVFTQAARRIRVVRLTGSRTAGPVPGPPLPPLAAGSQGLSMIDVLPAQSVTVARTASPPGYAISSSVSCAVTWWSPIVVGSVCQSGLSCGRTSIVADLMQASST
jgi:hypothetical protein